MLNTNVPSITDARAELARAQANLEAAERAERARDAVQADDERTAQERRERECGPELRELEQLREECDATAFFRDLDPHFAVIADKYVAIVKELEHVKKKIDAREIKVSREKRVAEDVGVPSGCHTLPRRTIQRRAGRAVAKALENEGLLRFARALDAHEWVEPDV